ncbi:HAMP domain-containing protein [bacterium]|nr:HAMP domain-containing protein [bacterium]
MYKRKSIFWQLFTSHLVLVGFSVLAVVWIALSIFQQFYYSNTADNLTVRSRLLAGQLSRMIQQEKYTEMDRMITSMGKETGTRITIVLPDGRVAGDSHEDAAKLENHGDRPEVISAGKQGIGSSHRYSYSLKQYMMYTAIVLRGEDGVLQGFVRTSLPLNGLQQALLAMNKKILLGVFFIIILTAAISFWVSQRMIKPLVTIKQGAEKYAAGDLEHKLYTDGSEEIKSLADTLNMMAVQLKQRIESSEHQRQEQAAILTGMTEGVLAVDGRENVVYMNSSAKQLFEVEPNWDVGKKIQEIIRDPSLHAFIALTLVSEESTTAELKFYKNGEKMMRVTGAKIKAANNTVNGAIIVLNDFTQLHRLETIRREFVSNVSHELKTPITLIQGFVETLLDDKQLTRDETQKFLKKIEKHSHRLNAIIEDLLDLSRIEQLGFDKLEKKKTGVFEMVENSIQTCMSAYRDTQVSINNSISKEMQAGLNQPLFEQALFNLLENAVKYSNSKTPVVVKGGREKKKNIIEVRDFGCGIAGEHLPRIFERFYRVDKSRSRDEGGTGLGLAIVKHIVQAHGGEIAVESTLEKGTCFRITLPE